MPTKAQTNPALKAANRRMCLAIENDARETARWTGRGVISPSVMAQMAGVPRHRFMGFADSDPAATGAYANRAQPIAQRQTISQPFIVAVMTDLLDLEPDDRVLEVGTGCGYQTAILAGLSAEVYSVERIPVLSAEAARNLEALDISNAFLRIGDGFDGWPEHAPYDAIIVTAAPRTAPPALLDQLAPGGRLVVPVGEADGSQMLQRFVRRADGETTVAGLLPVAFVPMIGDVAT
ncbi:MAG: protein-L-isoaspartate(D-aspartate) O-methyltransferase [Rhodospirillales bacterium]